MARKEILPDAAQGRTKALVVIISDDFDVTPARVPSGLPGTPDGRVIDWFSNFQVQKKAGKPKTDKQVKYSIELDNVEGDLYYYDDLSKTAIQLTKRNADNGRIQADLSVDDPPIGHT